MRLNELKTILFLSAALTVPIAPAQEMAAINTPSGEEEVVVTGLRGKARTVVASPAPIDVIPASQLAETGKVGLKEILNNSIPSLNLPGVNGGGTSWTVRAFTLRGLNGDQALFLINGKRRHTTALINNLARIGSGGVPVDLDMIPAASIQRIEVLRDGAAAQYGSDAIAGVINIILKDDDDGGLLQGTLGQTFEGDGETWQLGGTYGLKLSDDGFLTLGFNAKNSDVASRSDPSTATNLYNLLPDGSLDPREATIDRYAFGKSYGPGKEDIYAISYNGAQDIGEDLRFYSTGTFSYRDAFKNTGSFLPKFVNSLPEIYPNGFNAFRRILETDLQTTFGLKGEVSGWAWDISTTYAQDHADLRGVNTLNASLGPSSPTRFKLSAHTFDQWTNNLDVTRDFEIGLDGPLTVALGLEHRYEHFRIEAGDPASYANGDYIIPAGQPHAGEVPRPGLASYNGTTPAEAGTISQNVYAGYIDLSANITETWYVGIAGRYESYSGGVGDTFSGKFSTRWEFLPGYAVRATVSNGFRAPSLAQTIFASSTQTARILPDGEVERIALKVLPVDSPEAKALGATPLKPETSVNYSVGFTAEPLDGLKVTVDAYRIDIDDRIVQTGILQGPVVEALLLAAGFQRGLSVQYYTNAVNTRTEGVDVVAEYFLDLEDSGTLNLSAAYTTTDTKITGFAPTPAQLANLGYELFDRQKRADLTIAQPKDKLILGARWQWDRFTVAGKVTRYGEYSEWSTVSRVVNGVVTYPNDRTYSAKWITDIDIAYDVTEDFTVAVGTNNLFDVYPDGIGVINTDTGLGRYGNFSPFGITGGYYYLRFSQSF